VNQLFCYLSEALYYAVNIYSLALFAYAVMSWVPELRRSRWAYYLGAIVEPVLMPIRRIIPPLGGLDLAFLVLILVLQLLVRPAIASLAFNSCVAIF